MVTRINPGINAHTIHPGVVLSTDEWDRLTAPLGLAAGHPLNEVVEVLTGRVAQSYNVAHLVRELIDAGCGGQSVPPTELPEQIRKLGETRRAAEHTAKQLAGEVADLTDRLDMKLPDLFATILRDTAHNMHERRVDIGAEDVLELGIDALALATQILDTYDVRDRDEARPVDPDPAARFTVTLGDAAGSSPFVRTGPGTVTNSEPITQNVYGVPITDAHPAVLYLAAHLGALKGCDGSLDCKRATVARTLLDAAEDLGDATESLHGEPLDRFTRRVAERLADTTADQHTLQALADLTRAAWTHAARIIFPGAGDAMTRGVVGEPCRICDGRGPVHRLGCPNG